jgi:hypothetical protein
MVYSGELINSCKEKGDKDEKSVHMGIANA